MFGILVYLFGVALHKTLKKDRSFLLLIALTGLLYGVAMEFVQKYMVANRSFDYADIIADGAGCLLAYILLLYRFRNQQFSTE